MSEPRSFSRAYLVFALSVLACANLVNYLDRQVVSALEREIVAAFSLSKAEFGGLWSAFTLGYMAFAPVLGWAASRWSRTRLFATCVAVWSLATIGSGLAPDKNILFLTRFFIGVGEAGCVVMGPALVAEYVSDRARGRMLSIYALGMPLGGTASHGRDAHAPLPDHTNTFPQRRFRTRARWRRRMCPTPPRRPSPS